MHNLSQDSSIPAFLAKLWRLVEDTNTNSLITWSSDGRSFIINQQSEFAKELLPLNYKHNNMASFIRQLNMYGFHKITSIDNGGLKYDKDEIEFSHPYFQKGMPAFLEHIKRKIANPKQSEEKNTGKVAAVNRVLNEVKTMRGRQDTLDSRFSAMKQENEALWREVAILRQKHIKQQQIVNKLIQFLVTLVQPSRSSTTGLNMGGKRRFQLMIKPNDSSPNTSKETKTKDGPVIRELTEELLDEVASDGEDNIEFPSVQSPGEVSNSPYLEDDNFQEPDYEDVDDAVDEIDTNNMAIYNAEVASNIKREDVTQDLSNSGHKRTHQQAFDIMGTETSADKRQAFNDPSSSSSGNDGKKLLSEMTTGPVAGQSLLLNNSSERGKTAVDLELSSDNFISAQTLPSGSGILNSPSTSREINSIEKQLYGKDNYDLTNEMPNELFNSQSPIPDTDSLNYFSEGFSPNPNSSLNEDTLKLTKYKPSANDIYKLQTHSDFDNHLGTVQSDLDTLKDMLRSDSYQFDANTLLGLQASVDPSSRIFLPQTAFDDETLNKLFGGDDMLPSYDFGNDQIASGNRKDLNTPSSSTHGSEMMSYQPNLFNYVDLHELLDNVDNEENE